MGAAVGVSFTSSSQTKLQLHNRSRRKSIDPGVSLRANTLRARRDSLAVLESVVRMDVGSGEDGRFCRTDARALNRKLGLDGIPDIRVDRGQHKVLALQ